MAQTPRKPSSPRQRRAGPTDIRDPMVRNEAKKALIWLGIAGLMVLAVVLAQPLMVVFGGMVFGALLDGGARLLRRVLPIPRIWRVAIVLAAAAGFAIWFATYAGSQITLQAAALPEILMAQAEKGLHWAERHRLITLNRSTIQTFTEQAIAGAAQLPSVLGGLFGGMATLFLILVLGVYFAVDPQPYQRGLAWMLPRESRPFFEQMFTQMGHTMRRLLFGRLVGMVIEGLTIGLALSAYGVPMATLLGLITGVLAFLPNIGAPVSGLLMVMVGFSGGTSMGLYCIGVYIVVQGIDGNIVVPMVAKKTADLAPALVLAMQLMMGALFGILGLALADPMLAMLKVLLEKLAARGAMAHDAGEMTEQV
ncbi:AI-2E family transporter [Novosphingobium humi]|uniref:AI-2E family transporter n=1 Tax=Novosphingobium humi TaxID=2282397 RepID=UPI0025AFB1B4|nr:AI-2E family transporter [Novosphingobium humi]WJS98699.1 AI-2E family transporter [Novosphingobium humi]